MRFRPATDAPQPSPTADPQHPQSAVTAENDHWVSTLRGDGAERDAAVRRLHDLLLRAARFEAARRRPTLPNLLAAELDDLTVQAAGDALVAVLARLDEFRGASRFTTWAYKFAIYQTAVTLRRRAWHDREVLLEPASWLPLTDHDPGPQHAAEYAELLTAVQDGISTALTPHQRHVLVALAVNGVPIDVLADRLGTTRGALYKTVHDARRKLRADLSSRGLTPPVMTRSEEPK